MQSLRHLAKSSGKIRITALIIIFLAFVVSGNALLLPRLAHGAAVTSFKVTLDDSRPAATSNPGDWTIQFVTPTGAGDTTDTITLTFDSSPAIDISAVVLADVDLEYDSDGTPGNCTGTLTDITLKADPADATNWGYGLSGQVITFTHSSDGANQDIPTATCVIVRIGSTATTGAAGTDRDLNPSKTAAVGTADISTVDVAGTFGDTGTALVATIEGVSVSVTIDETMSVVIAEVSAANCNVNIVGTDQSDQAGHTDTAIDFGTLTAGNAFNHSCHQLTISTNGAGGYQTTLQKTQLLTSGANTIADGDCNAGTCTTTSAGAWSTTSENGFGYCMDDVTGDAAATADATDWATANQCDSATRLYKLFTTTATTEPVMQSAASVSGDNSIIGVVLNYSLTQVPGTYTTTLLFITTPTF